MGDDLWYVVHPEATKKMLIFHILIGDVVYAPVLGINMVILNSHEVANELLSKRPNSTSGRHVSYLVHTL
jgi:hypothetical protein